MKERLTYCLRLFAVAVTVYIVVAVLSMLLFGGCSRRVVYVPAETLSARVDTVTRMVTRLERDTVRERVEVYDTRRDSVAPILDSTNRVVGVERWHWREVTRLADNERARLTATIDSLRRVRTDTVNRRDPYPVEVVKEVERKRRWWESGLMCLGVFMLTAAAFYIWSKRCR